MKVKSPQNQRSLPSQEWSPLELAEMKTGKCLGQIHRPKGFSSRRRIKPEEGSACYHVMSRTVNGEFLFGRTEKEAFRRMMWRMAQFSGVEIFTYAVMDNHFHILLKVPDQKKWLRRFEDRIDETAGAGEQRLLTHLSAVYSKAFIKQLKNELNSFRERGMEKAAMELLEKFKKRFCDVSLFVKELKERFSRWFNKQNGRCGTLWMDRFKSVCVDGEAALATMAAYIDLNPVRAGIVDDPLLYEWSGYGEASGGSKRARRGLCKALKVPQDSWETKGLARYRLFLFEEGVAIEPESVSHGKGRQPRKGIKMEARLKVIQQEGKLTPSEVLGKKVSSFSSGVAIGGEDFVQKMAARYRRDFGRKKQRSPRPMVGRDGGYFVFKE